jgi:hypothetical protein
LSKGLGWVRPAHQHGELLRLSPEHVWQPPYDGAGDVRDGAWVADRRGVLELSDWSRRMRVIPRIGRLAR